LDYEVTTSQVMNIPVVVMSAVAELLAPEVPADAYLPKPIDFDALLPLVEQYCEQARQRGM